MKHLIQLLFVLFTSLVCLAQQDMAMEIDAVFNQYSNAENVNNALLKVYSASKNIELSTGINKTSDKLIDVRHQPIYTASITKMLTAASIGILKDAKKLNFEDKIYQYLPESLTENLHVLGGKEYSKEITIAHLLQHTSGLPDYFEDQTIDSSPTILDQLFSRPDKFWKPQELIAFTKKKLRPLFVPGQGYHYTDTEYVLLGLIIEKVSSLSLDTFFRQFIFEPLGMNGSYINLKSSPIKKVLPVAKFYVGEIDVSSFKSLSADWGGGGWVSTTRDLIRFLIAYNKDQIVKKETRLEMQHWIGETVGMEYGFGIRKVSFKTLFDSDTDLQVIGHTGSTASFLWYCPQLDTYISGTLNQLEASKSTLNLVYDILKIIEKKQ